MKDVFLALWDLRSGEEEEPVNGEFQCNVADSVVKRDGRRVPGTGEECLAYLDQGL